MKFTIDTERKEITTTHDVKIRELVDFLKEKFPDDWGEYKFCITHNLNHYPIYVDRPYYPAWHDSAVYKDNSKPYQFEVKC